MIGVRDADLGGNPIILNYVDGISVLVSHCGVMFTAFSAFLINSGDHPVLFCVT